MDRQGIAQNIRLLMSVRGTTQETLAAALGVRQQYVAQMLSPPHKRLSRAAVGRVAQALGVPIEWLEDPALAGRTVTELRGEGDERNG